MDHTRQDDSDLRVGHHRELQRSRIVGRLLAQAVLLVAVLASVWWGMFVLGAHTLASEDGPSSSWLRPVYVGGCPVGGSGLAKGKAEEGCLEEGPSHPSGSRRPGAGLDGHAHRAEK